jgi:diguanylate cyclase (GGDEF)-like protein
MKTTPVTAVEAVTLEPPADQVWGPLLSDLIDVAAGAHGAPFLSALEAHARLLAHRRQMGMGDLFEGLQAGFAAFAEALEAAMTGEAAEVASRLRRLESEAQVRAGIGYARGLEEAVEQLSAQVDYLSPEDPLTGVMKESEIVRRLTVELDRCRRMEMSLGLSLVGVDCLAAVRRHGGPGEPNEFLRCIARLLGDSLRQYDAIGRRGDESFLVVLPDVSRRGLQSVMERFRSDLADECPAALQGQFSFALAHLDYFDLGADEMLLQLEGGLSRARAGGEPIVWV